MSQGDLPWVTEVRFFQVHYPMEQPLWEVVEAEPLKPFDKKLKKAPEGRNSYGFISPPKPPALPACSAASITQQVGCQEGLCLPQGANSGLQGMGCTA